MTMEYALAFAVAMLLWAILPGPGLAVVLARTLASGRGAGLAVITGLAIADFIFMAIAIIGLLAIATTMGPIFQFIKYGGAAYLVWRGYRELVGAKEPKTVDVGQSKVSWRDIGLGLLVTLGNPKAILFYGAVLPAFVDVTSIGPVDFLVLAGIVFGTSYVVYGGYIVLADRTRHLIGSTRMVKYLKRTTGAFLIGSGVMVATR